MTQVPSSSSDPVVPPPKLPLVIINRDREFKM